MSLPLGWTALGFDAARGVPQGAPIPHADPQLAGLRALLVVSPADLARLLSAPVEYVVHRSSERREPIPVVAGPAQALHRRARDEALHDFTSSAPDSIATEAMPVYLVVAAGRDVWASWPATTGRALPVAGPSGLIGHLWVDEVLLAAGTLIRPGQYGSGVAVGWRTTQPEHPPLSSEDPHDALV